MTRGIMVSRESILPTQRKQYRSEYKHTNFRSNARLEYDSHNVNTYLVEQQMTSYPPCDSVENNQSLNSPSSSTSTDDRRLENKQYGYKISTCELLYRTDT